jgi:hypothetical protein
VGARCWLGLAAAAVIALPGADAAAQSYADPRDCRNWLTPSHIAETDGIEFAEVEILRPGTYRIRYRGERRGQTGRIELRSTAADFPDRVAIAHVKSQRHGRGIVLAVGAEGEVRLDGADADSPAFWAEITDRGRGGADRILRPMHDLKCNALKEFPHLLTDEELAAYSRDGAIPDRAPRTVAHAESLESLLDTSPEARRADGGWGPGKGRLSDLVAEGTPAEPSPGGTLGGIAEGAAGEAARGEAEAESLRGLVPPDGGTDAGDAGGGLTGIVPVEAPEPPEVAAEPATDAPRAPAVARACAYPDFAPVSLSGLTPGTGYAVAGRRTAAAEVPALFYEPALGTLADDGQRVRLGGGDGDVHLLAVTAAVDGADGARDLFGRPLDRALMQPLPRAGAEGAPGPAAALPATLDLMVIGSAPVLAGADLAVLDAALGGAEAVARDLRILWHPVAGDGGLGPAESFADFAALAVRLAARKGDTGPSLTQPEVVERLGQGVAERLAGHDRPIALVVLGLEAVRYPSEMPLVMERMFDAVSARAPLVRLGEGAGAEPRQWLLVVLPYNAIDFAPGYIIGPVEASDPRVGTVAEQRKDDRTGLGPMIADPARVARTIAGNVAAARGGAAAAPAAAAAERFDPALRVVPLAEAYQDLSLVVPAADVLPALATLDATDKALKRQDRGEDPAVGEGAARDFLRMLEFRTDPGGALIGSRSDPGRIAVYMRARKDQIGRDSTLRAEFEGLQLVLDDFNTEQAAHPACTHLLIPRAELLPPG